MTRTFSETLGYEFADPSLLEEALTHRSAMGGQTIDYERLEFLGDRVLGLVVADMLMDAFPDENEGALARRLAALVREETLAAVARDLGLGAEIRLGAGESEGGGRENNALLADACEATIAAIYCDGGLEPARRFIEQHWSARLAAELAPPQDAKSTLQEWAQGRALPLPAYRVVEREGPDHAPLFTVSVEVVGKPPASATGLSKRVAEQAAAQALLDGIDDDG
jgi:ribonuclease-3